MIKNSILSSISYVAGITLICLVALAGCEADTEVDQTVEEILASQPTLTSFSPARADIESKIIVKGTNLNFASEAYIGDVACPIAQRINGQTLEIQIAASAESGQIRIVTAAGREAISEETIEVTYPVPVISSTFPDSALVNRNITIEGTNMQSVSKVFFGDVEGVIQFKEDRAVVVSVPNNENSPMEVSLRYNSQEGETVLPLKPGFRILIPAPKVTAWPGLMARDNEVFLTGEDLNLVTGILVGGEMATINTATANTISFNVPSAIVTGYTNITLTHGTSSEVTREQVPYINGQYENFIEFDNAAADVFSLSSSADPLAVQKINGTVAQPPFPGEAYYNLQMNTGTSSTIARMRIHNATENETWPDILNAGNYNDNPVLHFWMNTEDTNPILKIYIGSTASSNRRELTGSNTNTGNAWKLYAVRLKDFIPGLTEVGSVFEFRLNTGSSADTFPIIVNMDWIIVTDKVLTEFGAEDVTDLFKPAG